MGIPRLICLWKVTMIFSAPFNKVFHLNLVLEANYFSSLPVSYNFSGFQNIFLYNRYQQGYWQLFNYPISIWLRQTKLAISLFSPTDIFMTFYQIFIMLNWHLRNPELKCIFLLSSCFCEVLAHNNWKKLIFFFPSKISQFVSLLFHYGLIFSLYAIVQSFTCLKIWYTLFWDNATFKIIVNYI